MNMLFAIKILGVLLGLLVSTEGSRLKPLVRDKRVVNGRTSMIKEFPYLVGLELFSRHICGGAIISPYHIITAAHCVISNDDPRSYRIRTGSSLRELGGTIHLVRSIKVHPEFNFSPNSLSLVKGDVAVLNLVNQIRLDNKTRRSIPMFEVGERSWRNTPATALGWGLLDITGESSRLLQSVRLYIKNKLSCDSVWSLLTDGRGIQEGQICASDETKSVCNGDSGGPLVVNGRLAGIASAAMLCHSWPYPNVFTEISYYRKWIDDNTRINVDPVWDEVLMWDLYL